MSKLSRQQLIDLAAASYFGNIDKKKIDEVLTRIHDDVVATVRIDHLSHSGIHGLHKLFETLLSSYKMTCHEDFEVTSNAENKAATRFNVTLGKPDDAFDSPMQSQKPPLRRERIIPSPPRIPGWRKCSAVNRKTHISLSDTENWRN